MDVVEITGNSPQGRKRGKTMAKILWVGADFYMTKKVTVDYESGMTKYYSFSAIPKTVEEWLKEHSPKTWEEIEIERNPFGLVACMRSVEFDVETLNRNPFDMLAEYEQRAKEDVFFNKTMIEAVRQYIEEHELEGLTAEEFEERSIRKEREQLILELMEDAKAISGKNANEWTRTKERDIFRRCDEWNEEHYDNQEYGIFMCYQDKDSGDEFTGFCIEDDYFVTFPEEEEGVKEMTREERSNTIKAIKENTKAVIGAYQETDKPSETVERLIESMGYDKAVVAVATVVNRVSVHDGRIYDGVREWAKSIEDAPSNEVMKSLGIYGVDSWIHSAHVNQIGEAMKNYEPPKAEEVEQIHETEESDTLNVCNLSKEIKDSIDALAPTDIGNICDYSETDYISDIFAEWADGETSIYYHDIIKYISEHVEAVNDAIEEFGWDGCGSDLYKAGQMAEYLEINNWLWEHETDAYKVYALNWFRFEHGEEIRKEEWGRFVCEIEQYGQMDRIGEAVEIMRQCLDDDREREVA